MEPRQAVPLRNQRRVLASKVVPANAQGRSPEEEGGVTKPSLPRIRGGVPQKRVEPRQAVPSKNQGWSRTEEGGCCPTKQSGVELHTRGWSRAKPSFPTLRGGVAQKRVEPSQAVPSSNQGWSGTEASGARKAVPSSNRGWSRTQEDPGKQSCPCVPANAQMRSWTEGAAPSRCLEQPGAKLHRSGWSHAKLSPRAIRSGVPQKRMLASKAVPAYAQEQTGTEGAGLRPRDVIATPGRGRGQVDPAPLQHEADHSSVGRSRDARLQQSTSVTQDKYTIPHDTGQIHHPP